MSFLMEVALFGALFIASLSFGVLCYAIHDHFVDEDRHRP